MVALGKEPAIGLPRATLEAVKGEVMRALTGFHAAAPQALGVEVAALRSQCAPDQLAATFLALLRGLAEQKRIELTGSVARLPKHVATDNPADEKMWRQLQPILERAGFNGLTLAELASAAAMKEAPLKDFLFRKAKTGEVVRVTQERFYPRDTLARFAAIADKVARSLPGGKFTAAQVRDSTDIGRNRVIEILECFDRLGVTMRVGDLRTMRKNFPALSAE
jgi:selenocysteine-specific elongation factor